jgi:hypothetical protein
MIGNYHSVSVHNINFYGDKGNKGDNRFSRYF